MGKRRPLVAGNWKMNGTREQAASLIDGITRGFATLTGVEVAVCPPFVLIPPVADQLKRSGVAVAWGGQNLRQAYSRATAYAASQLDDARLGARAWQEFRKGHAGYPESLAFVAERVEGPTVLNPIDEAPFSTNASAQFGLAAIQNLALVGDHI